MSYRITAEVANQDAYVVHKIDHALAKNIYDRIKDAKSKGFFQIYHNRSIPKNIRTILNQDGYELLRVSRRNNSGIGYFAYYVKW